MRFGVAGPIAIVLWDQLGGLLLPSLAVSIVDLLLIMAYGIGLSVMIVRIMNASERWGVESALTARKVANSIHKRGEVEEEQPSRGASSTTSFQEAHFLRRLQEEIVTARRDGSHVSLIWLDVNVPGANPYPAQVERMATDVAELLASQSTNDRRLSEPDSERVRLLPAPPRQGAGPRVHAQAGPWPRPLLVPLRHRRVPKGSLRR